MVLASISRSYPLLLGRFLYITHPFATDILLCPFDLHVLSIPPAFVLSQNQTLKFWVCSRLYNSHFWTLKFKNKEIVLILLRLSPLLLSFYMCKKHLIFTILNNVFEQRELRIKFLFFWAFLHQKSFRSKGLVIL